MAWGAIWVGDVVKSNERGAGGGDVCGELVTIREGPFVRKAKGKRGIVGGGAWEGNESESYNGYDCRSVMQLIVVGGGELVGLVGGIEERGWDANVDSGGVQLEVRMHFVGNSGIGG